MSFFFWLNNTEMTSYIRQRFHSSSKDFRFFNVIAIFLDVFIDIHAMFFFEKIGIFPISGLVIFCPNHLFSLFEPTF